MDQSERWFIFAFAIIVLLIGALFYPVFAHEHGRTDPNWKQLSQEEKDWYKTLMRPDMPTLSCCGESDQYWCDIIKVRGDQVFCTITDDRDDLQFKRLHVPMGTEIEIPPEKMKFGPNDPQRPPSNPTGHSIVFLSSSRYVYCFVQSTGI